MLSKIKKNAPPLLLFSLVFFLVSCDKQPKDIVQTKQNATIQMIPQDIAEVKKGTLQKQTAFTGNIEAIHKTTLQSQINAIVQQLNIQIGDTVQKGQILAKLSDPDNLSRLAQAKANLAAAEAQLKLNHSLVERKQRLFNQGFIAKLELEQSQVEYQAQKENVNAQRANVDIAQKSADDAILSSPISGYVTQRHVEVGQSVSPGQILFEIVDPKALELKASISVNEHQNIILGQIIDFQIQGQKQGYQAKVTRISPIADVANRNITFFAQPLNQRPLSIGAFVTGYIRHNTVQTGFIIPSNSVIQEQNQSPYIWIIRSNKILKQNIKLLDSDEKQEIVLVSGLQDGDKVSLLRFNTQDIGRPVSINN